MDYYEQLEYLKKKYGAVPENYYLDVECTRKSTKNGRGNDGLFIHHDFEYDPANPLTSDLSKPELARQFDYKYQRAENLTYCDYLEHLMLHCKINVLRTRQLGGFIRDGIMNYFAPDLNRWYARPEDLFGWKKAAFSRIEPYYEDYRQIISDWVDELARHMDGSVTPKLLESLKANILGRKPK